MILLSHEETWISSRKKEAVMRMTRQQMDELINRHFGFEADHVVSAAKAQVACHRRRF